MGITQAPVITNLQGKAKVTLFPPRPQHALVQSPGKIIELQMINSTKKYGECFNLNIEKWGSVRVH